MHVRLALALIPLENRISVFPQPDKEPKDFSDDNWYQYIFGKMRAPSFDEFGQNRVSFVTFNYDRSLEHFLYEALLTRYRGGNSNAFELVKRIPIIHVHGMLGAFNPLGSDGRPYTPDVTTEAVQMAAGDIRIVSDADVETELFQTAREVLKRAKRIYFLGFGFNSDNVRRLEVFNEEWTEEQRSDVLVGGTIRGIGANDWKEIKRNILHEAWSTEAPSDIVNFFGEYAPLD